MTILLRQKPLPQVVRQIVQRDNGAWFDPEDLSTMFQDASGTTPVTALEQLVGRWLDKSGNGNHATQPITASRPTLSARYNRLLNSAILSTQSVTTVAAPYTLSFTGTGSVTLSGSATGTLAGTGANNRVSLSIAPAAGTLTLTVTGSVTLAMLAFGTLTAYQAITTATDYDSVGWPRYLRFDGIDDYMNLPYMGLYANGSASVVVGVMHNSSGSQAIISEANTAIGNPVYMLTRIAAIDTLNSFYRNDAGSSINANSESFIKGIIKIVSSIDTSILFSQSVNGSVPKSTSYARTVTAVNNTALGVLLRASASDFFNGNITGGLIITKSALSDTDRRRCEQFLSRKLSKLGVTLA